MSDLPPECPLKRNPAHGFTLVRARLPGSLSALASASTRQSSINVGSIDQGAPLVSQRENGSSQGGPLSSYRMIRRSVLKLESRAKPHHQQQSRTTGVSEITL